jgi:hypothetical protein
MPTINQRTPWNFLMTLLFVPVRIVCGVRNGGFICFQSLLA